MIRRALSSCLHGTLACTTAATLLAGCASQPGQPGQPPADGSGARAANPVQTMIVPADAGPLASALREAISAEGWQTAGYSTGASNMPGDARAMAQRARYRMTLTSSSAGACRDNDPSFLYQISIIENGSGKVPLAMSGGDCLSRIRSQFQQELVDDGLSLKPRVQTDRAPTPRP